MFNMKGNNEIFLTDKFKFDSIKNDFFKFKPHS